MTINAGSLNWRIASVAVLLVVLFALSQDPALASGGGDGCNPGRISNYTHYFAGADANNASSSFGGIYGTIFEYSPYVNGLSSTDTSSQWVMLDDGNTSQWAQVGWIEFRAGKRNVFVEFMDPGTATWDNYFPPYAINSSVEFKVLYDPTCPNKTCFSFFENSTTQLTGTKYNWTPTDAQSFAEIHDQASQIPGGYNNKSSGTNLHVYANAGSSGSWNPMDGHDMTSNGAPSWDNVSNKGLYGNTSYYTWDSACSS